MASYFPTEKLGQNTPLALAQGFVVDRGYLIGQVILVAEQGRLPLVRVVTIGLDSAGLCFLESAKESQQGSLAHSVLAQKSVNLSGLEVHRNVAKDLIFAVAER